MKKTDIVIKFNKMSIKSLLQEEDALKIKINNLRFSVDFGKTKNIHKISENRKDLARIKTIISEKLLNKNNEEN